MYGSYLVDLLALGPEANVNKKEVRKSLCVRCWSEVNYLFHGAYFILLLFLCYVL